MNESIKNHRLKITIGTAIAVVLFVVGVTNYITVRLGQMEAKDEIVLARIVSMESQLSENKAQIAILEAKGNEADIDRTKILTKLESIEVSIIELKQSLKDHDLN